MIKYMFWILWSVSFIFFMWMLIDEMKLKYLSMPAYIPIGLLWLAIVLFIKLGPKLDKVALIMVSITGVPLFLYGFFIVLIYIISFIFGPIRWN